MNASKSAAAALASDDPALLNELLYTVSAISRRRYDLVRPEAAERLIRHGWLEWAAGALRVTPSGFRVCDSVRLVPH